MRTLSVNEKSLSTQNFSLLVELVNSVGIGFLLFGNEKCCCKTENKGKKYTCIGYQ